MVPVKLKIDLIQGWRNMNLSAPALCRQSIAESDDGGSYKNETPGFPAPGFSG